MSDKRLHIDHNGSMKFPVEVKVNCEIKPSCVSDGSVKMLGPDGTIDVDIKITDALTGSLSLMPKNVVPSGKYSVQIEATALAPEGRPLEGPLVLSFMRAVA